MIAWADASGWLAEVWKQEKTPKELCKLLETVMAQAEDLQ